MRKAGRVSIRRCRCPDRRTHHIFRWCRLLQIYTRQHHRYPAYGRRIKKGDCNGFTAWRWFHNGSEPETCLYRPTYLSSACHDFLAFRQESSVTYLNNIGIKGVLSGDPNIVFLNPYDFLCSNGICKSLVGDEIIYSDDAHLSVVGSKMVIDYFSAQILALLRWEPRTSFGGFLQIRQVRIFGFGYHNIIIY